MSDSRESRRNALKIGVKQATDDLISWINNPDGVDQLRDLAAGNLLAELQPPAVVHSGIYRLARGGLGPIEPGDPQGFVLDELLLLATFSLPIRISNGGLVFMFGRASHNNRWRITDLIPFPYQRFAKSSSATVLEYWTKHDE